MFKKPYCLKYACNRKEQILAKCLLVVDSVACLILGMVAMVVVSRLCFKWQRRPNVDS